jgi:hypothetical protein
MLSKALPRPAASPGFVLASHVQQPDDFWMTTGAALPMDADTLEKVIRHIQRQFGDSPQDSPSIGMVPVPAVAAASTRTAAASEKGHAALLSVISESTL